MRNSVTVARQTLTLFVGVRIPIPQPIIIAHSFEWAIIFLIFKGIRTRREQINDLRKKTVRWTVFADVGNERSEAIGAIAPEKSLFLSQKNNSSFRVGCFYFIYLFSKYFLTFSKIVHNLRFLLKRNFLFDKIKVVRRR